jgi:hypothetical protein
MPVLARVWLPWVLLALAAGSALVLLVLVAASHLQARDDSQRLAREMGGAAASPRRSRYRGVVGGLDG